PAALEGEGPEGNLCLMRTVAAGEVGEVGDLVQLGIGVTQVHLARDERVAASCIDDDLAIERVGVTFGRLEDDAAGALALEIDLDDRGRLVDLDANFATVVDQDLVVLGANDLKCLETAFVIRKELRRGGREGVKVFAAAE